MPKKVDQNGKGKAVERIFDGETLYSQEQILEKYQSLRQWYGSWRLLPDSSYKALSCLHDAFFSLSLVVREDPGIRYLATRELDRIAADMKRSEGKQRGKKFEIIRAILEDETLMDATKYALSVQFCTSESTAGDAKREAPRFISRKKEFEKWQAF